MKAEGLTTAHCEPSPGGGSQFFPAHGSEFAVSFRCKPGNHWRPCTDTVTAATPNEAAQIIAATDYGMLTDGPYTSEQIMREWNLDDETESAEFLSLTRNKWKGEELAKAVGIEDVYIANLYKEYAENKVIAIWYRRVGEINKAMEYERDCDKIYKLIPNPTW